AREPAGCGERPSGQPIKSRPMSDPPEDERLERAVDDARRQAEGQATAEILALEQDLEGERREAARAPQEGQRRLDEAEAPAARPEAAGEAEDRERKLISERDEATAALREAREQLARLESEGAEADVQSDARRSERERELLEQSRAELEARIRREFEG